jgi:hypothetical protein
MDLHAHVRAWQREEDGSYKAELEGHSIHVKWKPEGAGERRGFLWTVSNAEGEVVAESEQVQEEIEIAMAEGERAARHAARSP